MIPFIILIVLSFLLGSIPFAYIFVKRIQGIDIRTQGSGNVGATNAARSLGKPMGVLILVLDVLKGVVTAGAIPWLMGYWIDHTLPLGGSMQDVFNLLSPKGVALCLGVAAFFGHCYSPFLGFKGGKGVATLLGVYIMVAPMALLMTFLVSGTLIALTRIVSLGSVTGAILLPVAVLFLYWDAYPVGEEYNRPWVSFLVTALVGAIVVFRHRSNLQRLRDGTEGGGGRREEEEEEEVWVKEEVWEEET